MGASLALARTSRVKKRDFTWSTTDEPHAIRRREILKKYPQIVELFGTEPLTFYIVLFYFLTQCTIAYLLRDADWWLILLLSYVVGGTINHSLQLAAHEISHNLVWQSVMANRITGILANLPTGVPSSVTFGRYHMDHHQYQGVDGIDTDIPCQIEVDYFTSCLLKLVWVFLQPLCYALRPILIKPKTFTLWEGINILCVFSFNGFVLYSFGNRSMSYLILGTLLGLGLHPASGHFIAEHYEFIRGQETYSYYGAWNYLNFNVGYHNEHHDFPKIPWSRLPALKALAPEFYALPCYSSYLSVFWAYITDPDMGPFARIKRKTSAKNYEILDKTTDTRKFKPLQILGFVTFLILLGLVFSSIFSDAQVKKVMA